uniref:AT5G43650 protein n=1 Tax=Arabidopsis thaliana TaxID=3702 RepID=C0Z2Y1_ARATH|nr:AT5G43650 [Arabidopsis thaliana]
MVNLLRKNWEEKKNTVAPEKERSRRHMLKERTRREKQKQSYLALHSLLPFATKIQCLKRFIILNQWEQN